MDSQIIIKFIGAMITAKATLPEKGGLGVFSPGAMTLSHKELINFYQQTNRGRHIAMRIASFAVPGLRS
jgi:hypothetical protein